MTYFFSFLSFLAIGISYYIFIAPKLRNMNEGTWDIKLETKLPDSETDTVVTISQQLTKTDPVPKISIPDYECRLQRRKHLFFVIGNSVHWRVQCEGVDLIQGAGNIKYQGDTFKGKLQMRQHGNDGTQKLFNIYLSGIRTDE